MRRNPILFLIAAALAFSPAAVYANPKEVTGNIPQSLSMSATCGTSVYTNALAANLYGNLPVTKISSAGTYNVSANDCGTLLSVQTFSNNGINLPDPGTLWAGFWLQVQNIQGGTWSIGPTASKTLNGGTASIFLQSGDGGILITDGSNWYYIGTSHPYNSASAPAVSACGTSPAIDGNANNGNGKVTVGSGTVSSCTVTFSGAGYPNWDHCVVTPETASVSAFAYSYSKTAITVTATSLTSIVFDYHCDGK